MKVWPPGKPTGPAVRPTARHHRPDLAGWAIRDEKPLVETRFGGDRELYRAWRDRLWREMYDAVHESRPVRRTVEDEEIVVMKAFGGDWAQYRVCRDRLQEELWQIMKVTDPR
ncbi:hypothetical protein NE235_27460 [Actinoallomurus spadix]|uniref:Uncharacterized protein n=1 Tax=Actinoallomurus spadix TaxID=79912 RepID=A0ABN0WIQ6_9ACTN|nr:hypothetical protein [Actinoallomurus spadix]MCO5989856.1 hypothetical protein [Actinoallomurus spadix]